MIPDNKTLSLFAPKKKILTVSELSEQIKSCLEKTIGAVWVSGQVSNLRQPVSGHLYFSIKDESSQIRCVLFDSTRRVLKFRIQDGLDIIIFGRVSVYKKSGDYQIIVDSAEPKGIGALQIAFEQLKKQLESEGLFDESRKKPIPFLPNTIGIVTSISGAALQDILNIIDRRFPTVHIIIYPVKVQGGGAKEEISQAIDDFSHLSYLSARGGSAYGTGQQEKDCYRPDVLIVGRGGGSAEDLWAFNEEIVARAISRSGIPVISAVGHEIDYTIADMVADKRALTPSEAAEIVLPIKSELIERLEHLHQKLIDSLHYQIEASKAKLDGLNKSYGWQTPQNKIREYYQRLDELSDKLTNYLKQKIETSSLIISNKAARLNNLSPLNVLSRGYSITRLKRNNQILKSVKQVNIGEDIITQLTDGQIKSTVKENNKTS
ncbi:MAG: exodeoxyribonuclease VII large subunit [Planctomycetota bacterium]